MNFFLHRCLGELEYRFNRRKTPGMFEETLRRIGERKPLPYQELIAEQMF